MKTSALELILKEYIELADGLKESCTIEDTWDCPESEEDDTRMRLLILKAKEELERIEITRYELKLQYS